jgi:hypothetical protein
MAALNGIIMAYRAAFCQHIKQVAVLNLEVHQQPWTARSVLVYDADADRALMGGAAGLDTSRDQAGRQAWLSEPQCVPHPLT